MGLDVSDRDSWFQICLPIRHEGFGLSRMQSVASMAFLAAWAHTSRELPLQLNSHELIDNLFERQSFEGSLSLYHHLSLAGATIQEQMPEKFLLSEKSLSQILKHPEMLQHRFTCTMADHDCNLLLGTENSHEVLARLGSVSGKGAGAFLQAIPTLNELAPKPAEFRLAACLRLGLHLPFQRMQDKCDCATHLDSFGYHLMTCKHGGGSVWAHDSIVSSWSECLKELAVLHKKEPKHRYLNSKGRLDILICDTGILSDQEMEISLAHPWSKVVIKKCVNLSGFVAKKIVEMKNAKYDNEIVPGGSAPKCVSAVFEHFDIWGVSTERLLNTLSLKSKDKEGNNDSADFKAYWRRRFSVTLQELNARVMMRN